MMGFRPNWRLILLITITISSILILAEYILKNNGYLKAVHLEIAATKKDFSELGNHFEHIRIEEASDVEDDVVGTIQHITGCISRPLIVESLQYGNYWLLTNLYRGTLSRTVNCAETITYTTHGDYTFIDNLEVLIQRWMAPISFALFAPGFDMQTTLTAIQYVRMCLPSSELIRKFVSFHLYFPLEHFPSFVPRDANQAHGWHYNCSEMPPYLNVSREQLYKTQANLTYPINVGRNIARKAANTHFVFASDIELYPSPNVVNGFLSMIANNPEIVTKGNTLRVFPLPIFELDEKSSLPNTKTELVKFLQLEMAVPFHYNICKSCHLVPLQEEWYLAEDSSNMSIFSITKRVDAFKHWEPIFISDNSVPFYDERLSWEGESDKRLQGFALCQLDYEYHVLHPAFLVHRPGIKKYHKQLQQLVYKTQTNELIAQLYTHEYQLLYGTNPKCGI